MNMKLLNTEDRRCPEVMLLVRQFLKTQLLSGDDVCEITTTEATTARDIPLFCSVKGYDLVSTRQDGNTFVYQVVRANSQALDQTSKPRHFAPEIYVVNVDQHKVARDKELHSKFQGLVHDLKSLMLGGFQLAIPCSFGKDSKVVLTAALVAHTELMAMPDSPITSATPFIVIHIDTATEVVPMQMYSAYAVKKLEQYCAEQNINLELHIQQPPLHEQFVSLFVGARKLPSTPNLNSDCAVIWKVDASERIQRKLLTQYGGDKLVACIGSRKAEGTTRAASLVRHGNDQRTVESLLQKNEKGLQTYAPIIDWATEDVFETLQRAGTNPMVAPTRGYEIPSFMQSNRLLIKIYGDSANDTCEVTIGDHQANKAGCGGAARNGCHQCFKAGKVDKSASSQNEHIRWGNIQKNATRVRDYVFSIAHDIEHRTMHPRTFDPVTNHVALQPNIIRSKTLEKMLWLYTQLTFDDYQRSERFKKLLDNGLELQDEGYADIYNDASMDSATKTEYLEMYRIGAQKHLIRMVTLEHAIYLSAQWSMDGVRSLPFRPLAIYDAVFNKGKRIPWPAPRDVVIDDIPDAITFSLCEPGVDLMAQWVPPTRPWAIIGGDTASGCTEEQIPDTIRVRVTYAIDAGGLEQIKITLNGKSLDLGAHTKAAVLKDARQRWSASDMGSPLTYSTFLTMRKTVSIGTKVSNEQKSARKRINFTRRSTKVNKSSGKITRHRTSMMMYKADPVSSLEESWTGTTEIWVPSETLTTVPYMSQIPADLNADDVNFLLDPEAIHSWVEFGGYANAISMHDTHLANVRRNKVRIGSTYSMRVYTGADAFWSIMQSGLISVTQASWENCFNTMKRTELFHEVGLFNFSDKYSDNIKHPQCNSMAEHRALKVHPLLGIRAQRNASRQQIKAKLELMATAPSLFVKSEIQSRFETMVALRDQYCANTWVDHTMLVAAGSTGFDSVSYVTLQALSDDWLHENNPAMMDAYAFAKAFGSRFERSLLNDDALTKVELNQIFRQANKKYCETLGRRFALWANYFRELSLLRCTAKTFTGQYQSSLQEAANKITERYAEEIPALSWSGLDIAAKYVGNYRSLFSMIRDSCDVLGFDWHQQRWLQLDIQQKEFADKLANLNKVADQADLLGELSGTSRTTAMARLMSLVA